MSMKNTLARRASVPLALTLFAMAWPTTVVGQAPGSDIVDRLIAIVGDSVVLDSQVIEQMARMGMEGAQIPAPTDPDYDEFYGVVLDGLVNRLLILQAAEADSTIQVDEAAIDEGVQRQLEGITQQYGGQPQLRQALAAEGLTLAAFREIQMNEARMAQLQQMYYQTELQGADPETVTEDEMLERFEEMRPSLQQRPKLITFRQLLVRPRPTDEAVGLARDTAEIMLQRVTDGEEFEALAMEHSDDSASAVQGGDLGWFRRGQMVREFEDAVFGMRDEQVSPIVETEFGFHVIKVINSRMSERRARHILIRPVLTPADTERAESLASELVGRAENGAVLSVLREEIDDAAEPTDIIPDSLTIPFDQISELAPSYGALTTSTSGQILGPLELLIAPGEIRYAVVQVVEIREAGAFTFDDLRGQIAARLQEEKQLERILQGLRDRTHVDVRR